MLQRIIPTNSLLQMLFDDTIAAISTPPGSGAIAVVRMSGSQAWSITEQIFSRENDPHTTSRIKLKPNHAAHGFIVDDSKNELVDEVVVVAYKGPNSYTGEDLIEISCHGSPFIVSQVLSLFVTRGARLAKAGEFTQRAYINGRLDLTQAEAVLDLIQAQTGRQSRQALSALTGAIGGKIQDVRNTLVELLSRIVAGIDFPEEVGEIPLDDVSDVVARAKALLEALVQTVRSGRFLREGLRLAIVGKPNAGKSSLLNRLLQFERAIVTDVPGTTRDSLEEMLDLKGIPVILVDTAGIRDTEDQVEKIGIQRTFQAIEAADLVLMVCDITSGWTEDDNLIAKMLTLKPHLLLANKCDLQEAPAAKKLCSRQVPRRLLRQRQDSPTGNRLICSWERSKFPPRKARGVTELSDEIESWVFKDERSRDAGASLNARQGELCTRAIEALKLVQTTVEHDMPQDCLATDLKTAVDCLSEICGEAVSEEIITNVFATFCIGK